MKSIIIIYILIGLIIWATLLGFYLPKKFNSTEWKNAWTEFKDNKKGYDGSESYSYLSPHKKMTRSLIKSNVLIGLSKQDVENLIGLESNDFESKEWQYWLAFTASDNKWLKVVFDGGDQVVEVYKYED